jgi:hypothetical protein
MAAALFLKDTLPIVQPQASTLPLVVKVVGFIISWATSIFYLWVTNPPKLISEHHAFRQVRTISIVSISIFLSLIWGTLGNSSGLPWLVSMAMALTALGIAVFFHTAEAISRLLNSGAKTAPIKLLFAFLLYTFTISSGLTSAGVFLVVILANPSNTQRGTSLVAAQSFNVRIHVQGQVDVRDDQQVPFAQSSGQVNLGCEETRQSQVIFQLPPGASLVGNPIASWRNTSNLSSASASAAIQGIDVVGTGSIRGLDSQNFGFVRNCPGGGHGELVVSGVYKSGTTHQQSKEVDLTSSVSNQTKETVWVTLPSTEAFHIESVKAVFEPAPPGSSPVVLTVNPTSRTAESAEGKIQINLDVEKNRLGLTLQ